MPGPDSLEIRLLAAFRVSIDGVAVEEERWIRRKAKTLVKVLALEASHEMSRDDAIATLWPELTGEPATNNFHKTLHAARRALEPDLKAGAVSRFLVTQDQRIALRARGGLFIDALEFEQKARAALAAGDPGRLSDALALYTGPLLPEDRLEDWCAVKRERLSNLHQDLLIRLANVSETAGRPQEAIDLLHLAVSAEPTNENAHRHLMRMFAATGNRHLALNQFRNCAEALKRELDTEPEPATVRLFEQLQSGEIGMVAAPAPPMPIHANGQPGAAEPLPVPARTTSRRRWILLGSMAGAAVASAAFYFSARSGSQRLPSLAVLPFGAPGGNLEYLSEGLTEGLISSLSQLRGLRVMARSTMFAYKGREADPRAVGRAVGVASVLTGSLSQHGDRLRLAIELVDATDGARIWGSQYMLSPSEANAVQGRLAADVASALAVPVRDAEQKQFARYATRDPKAYEAYLLGRYHWNQRTEAGFRNAIHYFEESIAADPNFALAYAGLADAYGLLSFEAAPPGEYLPKTKALAAKAVALDEQLAEGHTSLAMVGALYDWDWARAEAEFRRAIELNPGHATAHHWYAVHLNARGRVEEAKARFARALELDPLSRIINTNAGYPYHYTRDYEPALRAYRKALELDPNFVVAHGELMLLYEQTNRFEEAMGEAVQILTLSGDKALGDRLREVYRDRGYQAALREWKRALEEASRHRYVSPFRLAELAVRSGDKDEAFAWLEKAFEERSAPLVYLKVDPVWDPVRADPRFAALTARIGL